MNYMQKILRFCSENYFKVVRDTFTTLLAILLSCCSPQDLNFWKSLHCWRAQVRVSKHNLSRQCPYACIHKLWRPDSFIGTIRKHFTCIRYYFMEQDHICFCEERALTDALGAYKWMHQIIYQDPDPSTLVNALSASGNLELLSYGNSFHVLVLESPIESDDRVRNALITMYFRCGDPLTSD